MTRSQFFQHFDLLADQPDAVAKMRELVLELAIQGKVVAQNPKDEPATRLLERITAKSAAADNARAKKSRDEIESLTPTPFWHSTPSNWTVAPLGVVTNIIRGITFPSSAKGRIREKGTVACLRTANVQDEIEWDDLLFISESYVGRDDQWLKPNDLVISMANSAALVGKVAQAREVPEKASFGGFLAVIRPIELDSTYLLYFLRAPSLQAALRATSSQTTNIANISLGGMRPMPVAIPPLAEQRRIVAKVDELMALCDELAARQQARHAARAQLQQSALHHLLAARDPHTFATAWQRVRDQFHLLHDTPDALPQLRQAILQLAVQGRLVPQNPKDEPAGEKFGRNEELNANAPFEIPEQWTWTQLSQLADINGGFAFKSTDYTDEGTRVIRISDFDEFGFKDHKVVRHPFGPDLQKFTLAEYNILMAMTGGTVGKSYFVKSLPEPMVVNQRVATIKVSASVNPSYVDIAIRSEMTQEVIRKAKNSTNDNISMADIKGFLIPLPPLAEQKRIVARVEALLRQCDALEAQLHQTRTLGAHLLDSTLHHLLAA